MNRIPQFISQHLLLLVASGFIGGIVAGSCLIETRNSVLYIFGAIISCIFLAPLFFTHAANTKCAQHTLLIWLFFIAGFIHIRGALVLPRHQNHIYYHIENKKECSIVGTLLKSVQYDGILSRVVVEADLLKTIDSQQWTSVSGKVRLRLKGIWPESVLPGDRVMLRAKLYRPSTYNTPGVFDYRQFLATRDIWLTGSIRAPALVQKVESPSSILHRIQYFPERVRTAAGSFIDSNVTSPEIRGLYRAILIGDRSGVPEKILEQFRTSGTFHILAISGLHVGIIATLLYGLLVKLLLYSERIALYSSPHKIAAVISMPLLIFYGCLAGLQIPVTRAIIMSGIVLLAICSDRRRSIPALLASASLILLIIDPRQLFSVSFQLSFAAVSAILLFLPHFQYPRRILQDEDVPHYRKAWGKFCAFITAALVISWVALLATAPISLFTFHRYSLISPLSNLFIEPLICLLSLPLGLLALLFSWWLPEISNILFTLGGTGLTIAVQLASFFGELSPSFTWGPSPSGFSLILFYVMFAILARKHSREPETWGRLLLTLTCTFFLLFSHSRTHQEKQGSTTVDFIDVGQGSASLVSFTNGSRYLIDGGGPNRADVGKRVIAPFLWQKGITHLDGIILTHPDGDHCNGLEFIVERFKPEFLWTVSPDDQPVSDTYLSLLKSAQREGTRFLSPQPGTKLEGRNCFIECIDQTTIGSTDSAGHPNRRNSGLIVRISTPSGAVLFPGDIEKEDEKLLIKRKRNLRADIMLAPHHGSKTSLFQPFWDAVHPSTVIVSASAWKKNIYPARSLAAKARQNDLVLYTTYEYGTISVSLDTGAISSYTRNPQNPFLPPTHQTLPAVQFSAKAAGTTLP